jgi:hypothetical protein
MDLKPGTRLRSAVCATEVVVVRKPAKEVELRCGGAPMLPPGSDGGGQVDATHGNGTQMGKRYADADSGIEVLCTKPGDGSLSLGDTPLLQKDAKALPSSD